MKAQLQSFLLDMRHNIEQTMKPITHPNMFLPAISLGKILWINVLNLSLRSTRLAFLLIGGIASVFLQASAQNVCDDFESYPIGAFPSAGGWQLVWNGAGNGYQVVGH